eukprot:TRINITY_DN19834_c0_g1_i1.p1 TRINITY_DN19834_c0_g1~~TRINITY_DN19834_c0_g1_i1.p1  ORF type:complete len:271 (+),score=37.31 TRINITY_DN19834_c0_g1_i1:39-851(+)
MSISLHRSDEMSADYVFFFQAEDGIRDLVRSRGLGDVYKRQEYGGWVNVGMSQALHQLERELANARRINEFMYVPTYVPLASRVPAAADPNFDAFKLGNESLRRFLLTQGVRKPVLDSIISRDGLLDQLYQLGIYPKEDVSEPLSPRLRRQISEQHFELVNTAEAPPPAPKPRGPSMTLWHRVHPSEDFQLTVAEPTYQQERENYCMSYVSPEQRAARERRLQMKVHHLNKRAELIEAGADMIRAIENGTARTPARGGSQFIPAWGKVRF